jgi:ZIP family zinc transporter
MPAMLGHVIPFALIPAGIAFIGGVIAAVRSPSPRLRTMIQHFAAGVVAAAAAVELLPDAISKHSPIALAVGFAAGTAAMLAISKVMARFESEEGDEDHSHLVASEALAQAVQRGAGPEGMLGAVGVDVLIDGLLLGLAFVAGQKAGILLTIGFSLEMLSLGLATCATCRKYRWSVIKSMVSVLGVGLLLVIGAGLAATVLQSLTGAVLGGVLTFGLAALLFLVTEELLVEAHEVRENTVTTAMFFVGFLVLLMVDVLT